MQGIAASLYQRSAALVDRLEGGHRKLLLYWTIVASFACGIRLSFASVTEMPPLAQAAAVLPYVLVVGAPIASMMLAFHWFRNGPEMPQPDYRLALFGKWRGISAAAARRLPLYGVTGIMASLLVGMLLNIPVRTLEFLAAMPAMPPAPPSWFPTLYSVMLADLVVVSSLYAVAFVAALRKVPLFPRLLVVIWALDILAQIGIAHAMASTDGLPPAVAGALEQLLKGNLQKVLISMALWTPYLLLSKRVNLTFRHRVPA